MQSRKHFRTPIGDELDDVYSEFVASVRSQLDHHSGLADVADRTLIERDVSAYRRAGREITIQLDVPGGSKLYRRSLIPERPLEDYAVTSNSTHGRNSPSKSEDADSAGLGSAPQAAMPYLVSRSAYSDQTTAQLVSAAINFDPAAWGELVRRFDTTVRAVAASYRLQEADAADAVAMTWLRAMESLSTIRDPDRVGGWLCTTARRECLAILRRSAREFPSWETANAVTSTSPGPEEAAILREMSEGIRDALGSLSAPQERLITKMFLTEEWSWRKCDMPVGSVGPTRRRALTKIRKHLEESGLGRD